MKEKEVEVEEGSAEAAELQRNLQKQVFRAQLNNIDN